MTPRASMNCYHAGMDLEIRHPQLVAAIAETGSVTRAGERLNLSQSALSHQLRDIEDRLNTALFHRVGRRMVLTPAGEEVRRAAAQVLEIVRRAEEGIRDSAAGKTGVLRISTACYTCYHWLPAILREYRPKRSSSSSRQASASPRWRNGPSGRTSTRGRSAPSALRAAASSGAGARSRCARWPQSRSSRTSSSWSRAAHRRQRRASERAASCASSTPRDDLDIRLTHVVSTGKSDEPDPLVPHEHLKPAIGPL